MSKEFFFVISCLINLTDFFRQVKSVAFWRQAENLASQKLASQVEWWESNHTNDSWPYDREPSVHEVAKEAAFMVKVVMPIKYRLELIEYLESIYIRF